MVVFKFRNLKTGQAMPVPEGEFLVGRADNAYVHVDDPSVSRNHARLFNNDEGFFVEDLGSSNGTALRGAFLKAPATINFGDVVHIGSVPFRIDPEVAGEIESKPQPSARDVSPASMSRATERIPAIGEKPWVPAAIAPDKLAAPEVSSTDSDAEALNAIVIREPTPIAPFAPSQPKLAIPVSVKAATFVSPPTPQRSVAPQQQARQQALIEAAEKQSSIREPASRPALESPNPTENRAPENSWIWPVVIFLAGLGVGLLLGLVFAKIFLDMGGKPSLLP